MKAVIYARYSSDNQREASIEGQIRECTAFAEKNGITVLRHYIDRAISAKTDNRPEFQNMIKDGNKKLFDMIIVWKLDRFARNRYDSARYKAQLKKNGVKVVSATEVISDGAEGIILESMLEGFAEYYSVDLSEKVVRGMTDNALKCMFNGGTLPMGYVIDAEQHFQIDPVTAPYILDAFKQYDEGATMPHRRRRRRPLRLCPRKRQRLPRPYRLRRQRRQLPHRRQRQRRLRRFRPRRQRRLRQCRRQRQRRRRHLRRIRIMTTGRKPTRIIRMEIRTTAPSMRGIRIMTIKKIG